VVRLGKHAHSKQRKLFPHKLCSFMSSLCASPAGSASTECSFFNIRFGIVQNQEKFRCREGRKIGQNILIVQS